MYIHAETFLLHMVELYKKAGWERKEVHFSLEDLKMNILSEEVAHVINKDVLLSKLKTENMFGHNEDVPKWVFETIEKM